MKALDTEDVGEIAATGEAESAAVIQTGLLTATIRGPHLCFALI